MAFGGTNEKNLQQIIGGSQGSRVYSTDGLATTQCSGSGGFGSKTGLYFIDMNSPPNLTETARCITGRQNSGISNRKGEHSGVFHDENEVNQYAIGFNRKDGITSKIDVAYTLSASDYRGLNRNQIQTAVFIDLNEDGKITDNARCLHTRMDLGITKGKHEGERSGVLIEDAPRAILNPFKEKTYQNGRRIKEPDEPMFTITVTDRHGVIHKGRIRRLMPIECWRLQGFNTSDFQKVQNIGMSDSQLYKQAGNAITTNVMEAIGRNLIEFDRYETEVSV